MKNIIFDFGGVLLEWNPDNVYLEYFKNDKHVMNAFYDKTQIKVLNKEFDRGVPFDTILSNLAEKFPRYKEPILLWKQSWHKMLGNKIEGSIQILQKLHDNGYNLYGLTNWSAETFPYAYYTHDFFRLFKDIVVSGRENMIKPEPGIFELCLSRNNLIPEQSVFIDDSLENVLAATEIGMEAIYFRDPNQLQESLVYLGIKL
ncbi:MAG: gph 2 [Burkholderiales bacterium]|jgi:2-haloacid dehalogenase|nr:gph 2 [Burkholderiales bacterium]